MRNSGPASGRYHVLRVVDIEALLTLLRENNTTAEKRETRVNYTDTVW